MRQWTDKQRHLRDSYADRFVAWGAEHLRRDRLGEFPVREWRQVSESGLLGLPFGQEWGGLGQDLLTTMYVLEGLGHDCRDGGLNFSVSTHVVSTGVPIQRFGSTQLKQRYLPGICAGSTLGAHAITEPHGGSDAAGMRTTATAGR